MFIHRTSTSVNSAQNNNYNISTTYTTKQQQQQQHFTTYNHDYDTIHSNSYI